MKIADDSIQQAEKLFDIAYSLADIIALNSIETGTYEVGPRDHLTTFLNLVSTLRNGETKFVGLLQAKIREVLPAMAISLGLPPPPPPATPSSTHSASSSGNVPPSLMPSLTRFESTDSIVSSPYDSPTAVSGASQLTSAPMRFGVAHQVVPSSPDAGESAMALSMGVSHNIGSPAGSASESGLSENLGNTRNTNTFSSNYGPSSGFRS